jgi:hypothetical protein
MSDEKSENTLRRLLERAQIDKRMLTRLDLFTEFRAAMERKDVDAQLDIARRLKLNASDILAEKQRAAAAIAAGIEDAMATSDPDERTAKLLKAYELAAKTRYWAYDALGDIEAGNAAAIQEGDILKALDAIPPGRLSALAALLDNADIGVRVEAAAELKGVMPERVIPMLRQINKEEGGSSVGFAAMRALWPDTGSEPPANKESPTKP